MCIRDSLCCGPHAGNAVFYPGDQGAGPGARARRIPCLCGQMCIRDSAGDGSLVLKLYYTRDSYKVTYQYTGKVPTGASELPVSIGRRLMDPLAELVKIDAKSIGVGV